MPGLEGSLLFVIKRDDGGSNDRIANTKTVYSPPVLMNELSPSMAIESIPANNKTKTGDNSRNRNK